jgi:two-component system OmpR family sensor kinase
MGRINRKSRDEDGLFTLENEKDTHRDWVNENVSRASVWLLLLALSAILISALWVYGSLAAQVAERSDTAAEFFSKYLSADPANLPGRADSYFTNYTDAALSDLQLIGTDGSVLCASTSSYLKQMADSSDITNAVRRAGRSFHIGRDPLSGDFCLACSSAVVSSDGEVLAVVRCVSGFTNANLALLRSTAFFLILFGLGVLCVTLTTRRFSKSVMAPISRVNETAQMIAEGLYGVHIDPVYPGEIGELCRTINDMSDAIGRSEKLKNDFISSVSHELRTPLTAIGGWGETLLAGDLGGDEEMRRGLTIITSEASRLARMVEELLDFSRMESGNLTMQMERIDITPDIEDVVFMYMDAIHREGMTLEYDEADVLPEIIGDRNRLRQVFLNLLDNAVKHGGEGKRVRVEAYAQAQTLIISVRDWGAGIPSEELPHVKERFYKGSSKARGSGIGLAVADEIMKLHGGRLEINSVLGEGTLAVMVLPAIIGSPSGE